MRRFLALVALLAAVAITPVLAQDTPAGPVPSCSGSVASCSGGYTTSALSARSFRTPVRTFLSKRPARSTLVRIGNVLSVRPNCGG